MCEEVPARNEGFIVRRLGEETLILTASGEEIHLLNEMGSFVWDRIDGRRTVREIVEAICETYDVDPQTARDDAVAFLDELLEKGIVRLGRGGPGPRGKKAGAE